MPGALGCWLVTLLPQDSALQSCGSLFLTTRLFPATPAAAAAAARCSPRLSTGPRCVAGGGSHVARRAAASGTRRGDVDGGGGVSGAGGELSRRAGCSLLTQGALSSRASLEGIGGPLGRPFGVRVWRLHGLCPAAALARQLWAG